jgi:hypothetical protein
MTMMLSNLLPQHLALPHVASSKLSKTIVFGIRKMKHLLKEGFETFVHFYSSIKTGALVPT